MAYSYKGKKTEEETYSEINEQFLFAKKYLDSIHERMNQQEELYRSFIDKNNYPHGARVFDPRIFRVIETITPRLVANEPTGSFYPVESGDVVTAEIFSALMKYDWRRADMFEKLVRFVKSMLIFGTAFGRNHWDFREKMRTRMIPKKVGGRVIWTPNNKEEIKVTEFDGPNFEVLNIYDCYPDPNATNKQSMRWFVYRMFKTLDELKAENDVRGAEYWKNLDKLEEAYDKKQSDRRAADANDSYLQYREHRRIMLSTEELHGKDESNPEFVVLRRFSRDGWCDIVPDFGIVIREVENPYFHGDLPITYGVDYPYPGELFGMGEIEPIDRIQRAINAVLNQRLDNVQMTLNQMWKVKKNSGVDMHTLVSAPGNIITLEDMNSVEPVTIPDVTGPTFVQTMNYLTSALQNGSGITDYTIGIDNESNVANKTATGTRLIQQEANAQFKLKIQLFNHMVIQDIANQWKDLRIQFTTDNQKLRIIGKDTIQYLRDNTSLTKTGLDGEQLIPGDERPSKLEVGADENFAFLNLYPDDIQPSIVGDYDFIASVSSEQLSDPIALQENFFTAIERIQNPDWAQGLAQQGKMINYEALTEKVFDKLNLGLDVKDVLTEIPQQPQMPDPMQQPLDQMGMDQMVADTQVQNPFPSVYEQPTEQPPTV